MFHTEINLHHFNPISFLYVFIGFFASILKTNLTPNTSLKTKEFLVMKDNYFINNYEV